ncbi:MAG: hypothetical protein GYA24_10235 [Candidatus Lokiarchaeota archaeon]|nr:hypothetical protein [Candidatus Lokiarchaeota archaeon]
MSLTIFHVALVDALWQYLAAINYAVLGGITLAAFISLYCYQQWTKDARPAGFNTAPLIGVFLAVPWANGILNQFDPMTLPITIVGSIPVAVLCIVSLARARRARRAAADAAAARVSVKQSPRSRAAGSLDPVKAPRGVYKQAPPRAYNARYQSHKKYLQPRR